MAVMASEIKVGQLWKKNTGEYLVVKEIKDNIVFFYGSYQPSSAPSERWNYERLAHMNACLRKEPVSAYELIDEIGYTIGMEFSGNFSSESGVATIKEFFWNEVDGLCVRYEHGGWDRLPLEFYMKRIEEKKKEEVTTQLEQSLYPPADTKPAEGQIWQETCHDGDVCVWLLQDYSQVKLLSVVGTHPIKVGECTFYDWKHLPSRWKCLSLATDRYKVGQVWVNRYNGRVWTVKEVNSDGAGAILNNPTRGDVRVQVFTGPEKDYHLIKDVEDKEEKLSPLDFSVPAVGDIYEWTGNNYPGIPPRKRYTVSVVSEKKSIVELENLIGTYDFSPYLRTKWKLVYKYGSPIKVGKDYVFEKSAGEWLLSHGRRWWSIGNEATYTFYTEKGNKVEVSESEFQQNVLSGNWTIYPEEEVPQTIKSTLKNNSLGSFLPKGFEIDLSKIDDLEEIVSKPTKQEKKKMNLIEVMDIKDIQIKQVDEEVIKDKQCELAELFGYEASGNKKGEVIFRREGKLSGGIVITPEKLVQLFEKQIKEEAGCSSDTTLEAAINYGIVESVELATPEERNDEE